MRKRVIYVILVLIAVAVMPVHAGGSRLAYRELGDSLTAYAGFNTLAVPRVRIKNLRVNGNNVSVYTNATLSFLSLTPDELGRLRRKISGWTLGHEGGKISIYSDGYELSELVTPYAKGILREGGQHDLSGRRIALWGSHGLYEDTIQHRWHWQRATLWTTVEDLYSSQYTRLLTRMLTDAEAEVLQPRGQVGDSAAMTIGPSGYPRWTEGARYWLEYTGVPDSIWQDTHKRLPACKPTDKRDNYKDDLRCRPNWVNWLNRQQKIDLSLALHTDGTFYPSDTLKTGTLVIYSDKGLRSATELSDGRSRTINRNLADMVQTQLVEDIRHSFAADWPRRELKNSGYYEARAPEVPSMLLELLSHQSMADMKLGLDPKFQFAAARAIYKAIGRWLEGSEFTPTPLAPSKFKISKNADGIELSWTATRDSLEPKAIAIDYIVERRDGKGWTQIWTGKKTTAKLSFERGTLYELRVIATNKGGRSFPTETLCAYIAADDNAPTELVVNAFNTVRGPLWFSDSTYAGIVPGSHAIPEGIDYSYIGDVNDFRRTDEWQSDEVCGWGNCYRDLAGEGFVGNTHDYVKNYAADIIARGHSFVSANITALTIESNLDQYAHIYVIDGKEDKPVHLPALTSTPLTISGISEGTIPQACHNGKIIIEEDGQRREISYATKPNGKQLHAGSVSAFVPTRNEVVVARYKDTGLPACVRDTILNITRWGVPLEAIIR